MMTTLPIAILLSWLPCAGDPPTSVPATSQPASQPASIDPELVKRLIGGQQTGMEAVEATLHRMQQVAERLQAQHDAGQETQQLQRRIVDGIDELIEQARRNRKSAGRQERAQRSGERSSPRRHGSGTKGRGDAADPATASKEAGQRAAQGGEKSGAGRPMDKAALSRGWGYLPLREREQIAQGFDEKFNEKYSEQIIRYYQSLARTNRQEPPPK